MKKEEKFYIIQHWYKHTSEWLNLKNGNILFIQYEDLKNHPEKVYYQICICFVS